MKPLVASYTFLRDFDNCPRKAYHKHVAKDLPKEPMSPEMKYGIDVHEALEQRLRDKKPLSEGMKRYEPFAQFFEDKRPEVELMLGMRSDGSTCDFFDPSVYLRGKLDLSYFQDAAAKIAGVVDWKTGKPREDDLELRIFGLLLRCKYPKLEKVFGRYVWLKTFSVGALHDLSDALETYKSVKKRMGTIDHCAKTNYWPPQQNPLCGWCPVKKCEFNRSSK